VNCLWLKSELVMMEFFQVDLTIKEEQDDSVAQAVHRRTGQSVAQWILPGIAGVGLCP
jgi:hypothetical protein